MDTTTIAPGESTTEEVWDSAIIGGGAAGLSAGLVLARAWFAVQVLDGGAPRNDPAAHMRGYMTRDGMAPRDFIAAGQEELAGYGASIVQATVTEAERATDGTFGLQFDDGGSVRARSVLVATGLTDELPDIPGLAEGWARVVHHCPHCHGYEESGRRIVVIGSAMGALSAHQASLMRRHSTSVTFCVNGAALDQTERQRLTAYGVDVIDASGATSVDGVWAAGNVVNPRAQVVTAAGAGSTAGIAMSSWLLEHELSGSSAEFGGEGR